MPTYGRGYATPPTGGFSANQPTAAYMDPGAAATEPVGGMGDAYLGWYEPRRGGPAPDRGGNAGRARPAQALHRGAPERARAPVGTAKKAQQMDVPGDAIRGHVNHRDWKVPHNEGISGNRKASGGRLVQFAAYSVVTLLFAIGTMNFVYSIIVDDSPPLVVKSAHLMNPVVQQGGQVSYIAVYDKRQDCTPPQGDGNVHYKYEAVGTSLANATDKGKVIRDKVSGTIRDSWPAGKDLRGEGFVSVPDDLPEGTYELSATAIYNCSRSPTMLKAKTPTMTLQVVARKIEGSLAASPAAPSPVGAAKTNRSRLANTGQSTKNQQ